MEQQEKSKETYEKIINAGLEVLNRKDYHETVVEEIAEVAGVSKGTVFFYFKTKENLFKAIINHIMDQLEQMFDEIISKNDTPLNKLKMIYDSFIDFQLKHMSLFMSIRKEMGAVEPKIEDIRVRVENIGKKILPLVESMFKKGLVKRFDPQLNLTEVISSMLFMYASAVSSMVFFNRENVERIKEIFWNILLHGILNEDVSIEMLVFNDTKI